MIYYIADMHFGHTNVLRFDNRPFSDTAQMDDTLIQNWKAPLLLGKHYAVRRSQ